MEVCYSCFLAYISFTYSLLKASPFASSPLANIPISDLQPTESSTLFPILLTYNRLLVLDPNIARRLDWSSLPLISLCDHPDHGVRLLAIAALSKLRRWSEAKRQKIETEKVGRQCNMSDPDFNAPVEYGEEIVKLDGGGFDVRRIVINGWVLPLKETWRIKKGMNYCKT
jgi:hypothetical protein